jgi:hypothetical protein
MRAVLNLVQAAAVAFVLISLPTHALADNVSPAARLSAALGGALGDGMCNAGGMGHGGVSSTVEVRLGRSEAYRRRVALDAGRTAGIERQIGQCAAHGRTPPESCSLVASTASQTSLHAER